MKRSIMLIAVLGVGVIWYMTVRQHDVDKEMLPPYVTTVSAEPATTGLFAIGGAVHAADEAVAAAQIAGVVHLYVDAGDRVVAGQVLATIAAPEYAAGAAAAAADARRTEALEAQARRHWDDLNRDERAQYVLASQSARDNATQAAALAAKTRILAPATGVVLARMVDDGSTVLPGVALVRTGITDRREVTLTVPAAVGTDVQPGMEVGVRVGNDDMRGTIATVSPSADPVTRTIGVTVVLPHTVAPALGAWATVDLPVSSVVNDDAVAVPASAVVARYDDLFVFVVGNDSRVAQRRVTQMAIADETVIVTGIASGDRIAVSGAQILRDGDVVRVR